jgi:hypothetical protein
MILGLGLAFLSASFAGSPPSSGPGPGPIFQSEECEDLDLVAREYLSLERAGIRWQGGDPKCLAHLRLKTWKKDRVHAAPDPALADPDYVLPSNRKMKIKSKRTPDDRIVVSYSFVGKKDGKEGLVQDEFELRMNFGKNRSKQGCATLLRAPRYLVMDAQCVEE